ncbi:glycosyltransferase family 2 protein [Pelistega ratti]|uniref:glycosyltransferase family 2 protein n=1 Tax=Pelistega ratti TaxID=2652177 RepID=UPI00135A40FD|nr:glycosyltransferase family 2 protein [Pelistega ratti]
MSKVLTIAIPSYNVENYINQTLDSMVTIDNLNLLEIIIVNDGSKDNTINIATQYERTYPNSIKVIDKENGGHGSTINAGLQVATGKYFKIVDGDDWVDSKGLENLINFLKDIDVDLVLNPCIKVYESGEKEEQEPFKPGAPYNTVLPYQDIFKYLGKLQEMHMTTYKTNLLKENNIKITERIFYVDNEYILYPLLYVNTACLLQEELYQYRLGRVGQSVSIESLVKNRFMLETVIKNSLEFYYSQSKIQNLSPIRSKIYLDKVERLTYVRTRISLLYEAPQIAQSELQNFYKEIKYNYPIFYNHLSSKLIKLLIYTKFRYIGIIKNIYRVLKK